MPASAPFTVAIPARYGASRLPGKPLRLLGGEPLICHVARRALEAGAEQVVVATDDARIADVLSDERIRVCMTGAEHVSGSDRLAECARKLDWPDDTVVVNLQGDEPFVPASAVHEVVHTLLAGDASMATLATPIEDAESLFDPACVKLVRKRDGSALYFSRAPVPWARDAFGRSRQALPAALVFLRHIGIYAYRAGFLRRYAALEPTPLEQAEALEQLRALEHGYRIAVGLAPSPFAAGVDTETDLLRAERLLEAETRV